VGLCYRDWSSLNLCALTVNSKALALRFDSREIPRCGIAPFPAGNPQIPMPFPPIYGAGSPTHASPCPSSAVLSATSVSRVWVTSAFLPAQGKLWQVQKQLGKRQPLKTGKHRLRSKAVSGRGERACPPTCPRIYFRALYESRSQVLLRLPKAKSGWDQYARISTSQREANPEEKQTKRTRTLSWEHLHCQGRSSADREL